MLRVLLLLSVTLSILPETAHGLPIPIASPSPHPGPRPYDVTLNLMGVKPITVSLPLKTIMSHIEPILYLTATKLANYRDPGKPQAEPNRLMAHRKITQSHVNQNGVPWARIPKGAESIDLESILDERHYTRIEAMVREGLLRVEEEKDQNGWPGRRRLVYAWNSMGEGGTGTEELDVEYGTDMLSLLGKDNGLQKDIHGKTLFEKFLDGEIDVTEQSLFGKPIPQELSDDEAVRRTWGLPPPKKTGKMHPQPPRGPKCR